MDGVHTGLAPRWLATMVFIHTSIHFVYDHPENVTIGLSRRSIVLRQQHPKPLWI